MDMNKSSPKGAPMKVAAFSNNSVAFIAWSLAQPIPGCLGFAVKRINTATGVVEVLPSWVPFDGEDNKDWKPKGTDVWPIQRFSWKDFVGAVGNTYEYEIVPMNGAPGALVPMPDLAVRSNPITLSTDCGQFIKACFTHGILSTQSLAHKLPTDADGLPSSEALLKAISTPGDPIREKLHGGMVQFLLSLVTRAKTEGGSVLAALYELADPELVKALLDDKAFVEIVLGNTGKDDETNKAARAQLHAIGAKIIDRMLPDGSIPHNKFNIFKDKHGVARSVLTGSTNWTSTGLCTQSNNALIVESPELAKVYEAYYDLLKADGSAQGPALRTADAQRKANVKLPDGTDITVWFSPNMKDRTKPSKGAATPPDMAEVFDCMDKAKKQVLFLAFYPGFPSIISKIADMAGKRQDLLLRGAVSSSQAMGADGAKLFHRKGTPPVIVAASALEKQVGDMEKELLKLPDAHAIVHDKVVVIDPLSDDCVVILGSHNLGFKASYGNDENMLIIRGNKALAAAYMVHVLDVYDHYRFRYMQRFAKAGYKGVLKTDDTWQTRFFSGAAFEEMHLWTGDPVPATPDPVTANTAAKVPVAAPHVVVPQADTVPTVATAEAPATTPNSKVVSITTVPSPDKVA